MDEFDLFMIRQRALRRARLSGGDSRDLWNFAHWGDVGTEDHHPGRRKFSNELTVTVPAAMHPELTRRGEEEHHHWARIRPMSLNNSYAYISGFLTCMLACPALTGRSAREFSPRLRRVSATSEQFRSQKDCSAGWREFAHDVARVAKGLTGALDEG